MGDDYCLSGWAGGVGSLPVAGFAGVASVARVPGLSPAAGFGTDGVVGSVSMGILIIDETSGAPFDAGPPTGSVLDISGLGVATPGPDTGGWDIVSGAGAAAGAGASGRSDFKASVIDIYDVLGTTNVPSLPCRPTYRSSSLPRVWPNVT